MNALRKLHFTNLSAMVCVTQNRSRSRKVQAQRGQVIREGETLIEGQTGIVIVMLFIVSIINYKRIAISYRLIVLRIRHAGRLVKWRTQCPAEYVNRKHSAGHVARALVAQLNPVKSSQ